ncbi:MAG: phospholipase D-like domain-containing protein [Kiritimatiellaeota bacterium]|nr:phospholipase D-like domain-containing protein [Kiritimatiellota bacterium]
MSFTPLQAAKRAAAAASRKLLRKLSQQRWRPWWQRLHDHADAARMDDAGIAGTFEDWVTPDPVTLRDGTTVQLLKDGQALRAAYDAILAAQRRVCVEMYIFSSDEAGREFVELLCRKARDGVRVFVLYDSFGCYDTDPAIFAQLHASGVRLCEFHPLSPWRYRGRWRITQRDHRKLVLVDDRIAQLGGLNVGAEYAGPWIVRSRRRYRGKPWRDTGLVLVGPQVKLLVSAFARIWRYANHGGELAAAEYVVPLATGGDFGVLASAPVQQSRITPITQQLIAAAQRSLWVTMAYFAPTDAIIGALCAAARRGVSVRLILPGVSDVPLLRIAARSFFTRMLEAGVEIYERRGPMLHAKTICLDGELSIIGSANLDYRSFESNCELSVAIRSPVLGAQMHAMFEHDVHHSRRITLGNWRRRPWLDALLQRLANLLRRWL